MSAEDAASTIAPKGPHPAPGPHLSPVELDSLALSLLPEEERARAQAHVDACEQCRAELAAAGAHRDEFSRAVFPRTVEPLRERSRRRSLWSWLRWPSLAVPALAAAAAAGFLLVKDRNRTVEPVEGPGIGGEHGLAVKGDSLFQVFRRQPEGGPAPVLEGARVRTGDEIRFVVMPGESAFVLVVSIDGAGTASVYHPFGGTASGPVTPRQRTELPGSLVLDDSPGPERFFALFSKEPLDAAPVLEALRGIGARGANAIRSERRLELAGAAAQSTLLVEKEAP